MAILAGIGNICSLYRPSPIPIMFPIPAIMAGIGDIDKGNSDKVTPIPVKRISRYRRFAYYRSTGIRDPTVPR